MTTSLLSILCFRLGNQLCKKICYRSIYCTGIPRLVRFFGPQQTALIGDYLRHLQRKIETVSKKFTLECCQVRQKPSKLFLKHRFQDFLWHDKFLFPIYKHIPIVWLAQVSEKGPSFLEFNLCPIHLFAKKNMSTL